MISKQNVYLNSDRTRAVTEDDKDAKFLLVREGHEIENAEAEKYEDAVDLIGSGGPKAKATATAEPADPKRKAKKSAK